MDFRDFIICVGHRTCAGCMQQEEGPSTLLLPALATPCTLTYPELLGHWVEPSSLTPGFLLGPEAILPPNSPRSPLLLALSCTPSHSRGHPSPGSPAMVPIASLAGDLCSPREPCPVLEAPSGGRAAVPRVPALPGLPCLVRGSAEAVRRELKGRGMFSQFILQKESLQGVRGRLLAAKVLTNSR